MSSLLISVRTGEEAEVVLRHDVPFLDVKEPHAGSLGKATDHEIARVVAAAKQRPEVTVSAALGEIGDVDLARWKPIAGVTLYKLGLAAQAGKDWRLQAREWRDRIGALAPDASLILAAYADAHLAAAPAPTEVLTTATELGLRFFLVDTYDKHAGSLTTWLTEPEIAALVRETHQAGLRVALAGSLRLEELRMVSSLGADVLAIRGAVCAAAERNAQLDVRRVEKACRLARAIEETY